MNNFNGAMEVLSGLNSAPVRKLQMTWKVRRHSQSVADNKLGWRAQPTRCLVGRFVPPTQLLPPSDQETLNTVNTVLSATGNFNNYRRAVASATLPVVPYFGTRPR